MGCSRHPHEGAVGICASCVSERLNKEGRKFPVTGRITKLPASSAEEYFLWKEENAPSSSSSVSKHGQLAKGGRIVDTIATLIKTDYAIPNNYERPKSSRSRHHQQRSSNRRREHSTKSYNANPAEPSSSSRAIIISEAAAAAGSSSYSRSKKADYEDGNGNADADFRKFTGSELSKGKRQIIDDGNHSSSSVLTKSGEICEIVPADEEEEEEEEEGGRALALVVDRGGEEKPVQTIHSLIDAEPKSGKFSRSTSKGSPASSSYSHFSRSGSRQPQQQQQQQQPSSSWTVFWRPSSHKDDGAGQSSSTSGGSLVPAGGGRTAVVGGVGIGRGRTSVRSVNHEDDERNHHDDDGGERWDRPSTSHHHPHHPHQGESSSSQTNRHYYPDRRLTRPRGREEKEEEEEEEGVSSNGGRRRSRQPVYDDGYEYQQNRLQRRDGNSPPWGRQQQQQPQRGGVVVPSYIYERGRNQTWDDQPGLIPGPDHYAPPSPPPPPTTKKKTNTSNYPTPPPHHHNITNTSNDSSNASGKIFNHNGSTGSSNDVNELQQALRNRWKVVKKKSGKLLLHRSGGKQPVAGDSRQDQHIWPPEEDAGGGQSSSGKLTPCTSNCFPKATGRFQHHSTNNVNALRREDANLSHEKLRHRRLSIYSYGIISHPQLNPLDSHLSSYSYPGGGSAGVGGGGRGVGSNGSRGPSALPYRGSNPPSGPKDSYYNSSQNGGKRLVTDLWDGDELSVSPCDHYVEVSHGDDGGVDFIPVSEAWARAYDRMERKDIEGRRSPPSWNERTVRQSSQVDEEEEEEDHYSSDSISGFGGKAGELAPVYEDECDRGYDNYPLDREPDDEYLHEEKHEFKDEKEFESHRSLESPTNSETPRGEAGIKSRQAKGKNVISEIEELEGEDDYYDHETDEKNDDNHSKRGKQQQHIGGYTLVTAKSPLSDAGSQSGLQILPARNSLRALLYLDGEEVIVIQKKRGGEEEEDDEDDEGHEERSNKPDDATYELELEEDEEDHEQEEEQEEEDEDGSWAVDSADVDQADSQTNDDSAAGIRVSPWKNITLSSSMRRKFLWPRSSPQPHVRKTSEISGNSGPLESEHHHQHQSSLSFSDSEFHLPRPRSPTSTVDNASSNVVTSECPEGPHRGSLSDHTLQDEVTGETVFSLVEEVEEEASPKSSPQRSSLSQASSPQRAASLSRSSSKSPHRTLSRGSSRRSRSSSWSSCLTDPAWTSQSQVPSKKGDSKGSQEKGGRFSSIIRLGKKLRRRSSPASKSLNTSPWLGFSKASPPHREETASV